MNTLLYITVFVCLFFYSCNTNNYNNETSNDTTNGKVVDSTRDAIFDMWLDGQKWNKNDSAYARFFVQKNRLLFNIEANYESALYQHIMFMSLIDTLGNSTVYDVSTLKDSTLLCTVNYMFAEYDFDADPYMPKNYMALSLSPTVYLTFTKIDTVLQTISGTFKGYAEDNIRRVHTFNNGIFLTSRIKRSEAAIGYPIDCKF